jgi:hypothetical protein
MHSSDELTHRSLLDADVLIRANVTHVMKIDGVLLGDTGLHQAEVTSPSRATSA